MRWIRMGWWIIRRRRRRRRLRRVMAALHLGLPGVVQPRADADRAVNAELGDRGG